MLSYSNKAKPINSRRNEKRKSFTAGFKLEKVLEYKRQFLSSNKFANLIGIPTSTFQGWVTDHHNEVLTSVYVASTEADRKRWRKAEYPEVEKILVVYLEHRRFLYQQDKCGLSWLILQVLSYVHVIYHVSFYTLTLVYWYFFTYVWHQDRAAQIAKDTLSPEECAGFKISPLIIFLFFWIFENIIGHS